MGREANTVEHPPCTQGDSAIRVNRAGWDQEGHGPLGHYLHPSFTSFSLSTRSQTLSRLGAPLVPDSWHPLSSRHTDTSSWIQQGSSTGQDQALNPYDGAFSEVISKRAEIPWLCFQVLFKTTQPQPGFTWSHEPGWCRSCSDWPSNGTLSIKYNTIQYNTKKILQTTRVTEVIWMVDSLLCSTWLSHPITTFLLLTLLWVTLLPI